MAAEWFCQIMGSEVGPLSQSQLVDMVRNHQVNPEDLIRRGSSSWVPAFQVKGLFEAAAKPPPQPQLQPEPQPEPNDTEPPPVSLHSSDANAYRVDSAHDAVASAVRDIRESAKDASDWFCIASGKKCGPLQFGELQELARAGTLRGKDRVWRGSWPKFRRASEVDGLEAVG